MSILKKSILLLLITWLSACASIPQPDLVRMYKNISAQPSENPVIVIHGAFGSQLRDKNSLEDMWPGGAASILFSDFSYIGLNIDEISLQPTASLLEAYKIADNIIGTDFYGNLIDTLEEAGSYKPTIVGTPINDQHRRFYVFVYDWRQDNVDSAKQLHQLIQQIRQDYQKPDLKVDIIAHSMGGLIARYFVRYGSQDVLDGNDFPVNNVGAEMVRKVILVGTPNLGSVDALQNIIRGLPVGFGNIPSEVLISMPSAYQLLPHPLNSWIVSIDGETLKHDLFDIKVWKNFKWSIFDPEVRQRIEEQFIDPARAQLYLQNLEKYFEKYLERGRRFVWSLTVDLPYQPTEYVVFGGDCYDTPARILVEKINGISEVRLNPDEIENPLEGVDYEQLLLEPGDGTVTKASLLSRTILDPSSPRPSYAHFPLDYSIMFCERHSQLTGNINFQNNLLNILLSSHKQ
jgi:pimeloyl-ACP methyl ester carboxylesterase